MQENTIPAQSIASLAINKAVLRSKPRSGAALGIYGRTASALAVSAANVEKRLRTRYALRDCSGTLMPKEAVARCGRHLAPSSGGVHVLYSPSAQTAHFGGLEACHSVWMCPCCAAKITERRRLELTIALREARDLGLRVVMCTFTFRHHLGEHLPTMLKSMKRGWKLLMSGRRAQALRLAFGPVGFVKALEVTYSDDNGWHPHMHVLFFLPAGTSSKAFGSALRTLWEEAAYSAGLSMDEHGFKIDDCNEKVAAYVAKFNRDPSEDTKKAWEQGWTEANELTKWHTKLGRDEAGRPEHVTPMQLLQYAEGGDERAGRLFQEYARAFKGQRQLFWSRGLKKLFGIDEKTDTEIAEEETADAERLAFLYLEEWQVVLKRNKRVDLLMVARKGTMDLVADFLYGLGLERFAPGGAGRNG